MLSVTSKYFMPSVIMLNVIMLNVIMLHVVTLNVIRLSVVMLCVVAPVRGVYHKTFYGSNSVQSLLVKSL